MGYPLDELSAAAEEADDAYGQAVNTAAEAIADYEYAYWIAHQEAFDHAGSAAACDALAQEASLDAKVAKVRAEGAEKRCKKHLDVVLARLSAEQTKVRFEDRLT